jgi:hypothetical protein
MIKIRKVYFKYNYKLTFFIKFLQKFWPLNFKLTEKNTPVK